MSVRLAVVASGDNGQICGLFQTAPNGGWSSWQSLGNPAGERLDVAALTSSHDGRLELFAFSTTHPGLWHRWQTAKYGAWSDWDRIPDPPGVTWSEGNLAVSPGADGRLELFCVNGTERDTPLDQPNNQVWHRWQTAVNGGWSAWRSVGQPPDAEQLGLNLATNADGRLDLFAGVATPGRETEQFHAWHLAQTAPNGTWSSWAMVTDYPDPFKPYILSSIGRNEDRRLEAFAVEAEAGMAWQTFQITPNGGWHTWVSRGKPAGRKLQDPAIVAANADGRLELFAPGIVDEDHLDLWHVWQTAPNNGWSAWNSFGSPGGGFGWGNTVLAIGSASDGALHVFATPADGNLWHRWQTQPSNGWSAWTNRGRPAGSTQLWQSAVHAS